MNKNEATLEEERIRAEKEYDHVVTELSRYDTDAQKLVTFISLLLTTAFIFGVEKKINYIFPIVPIIAIMIVQYLLANNYAYRVRELYVYKLEGILRNNGNYPSLYSKQIKKHFIELSFFQAVLLPFSASILYTIFLVLIIAVFSSNKAFYYLEARLNTKWAVVYLCLIVTMVIYTCFTCYWSYKRLSTEYREKLT